MREAGLSPHPRPFPVVHEGRPVAEIDIAFPEVSYGVEIDGPPHLVPAQAAADRARDRRLGRLGWSIDRFTDEEVEGAPAAFVGHVEPRVAALGRAAAR